jgi:hypothetical protein
MVLLQAELGDGQMNHALPVGDQAVPLDQKIEGRKAKRHAASEMVGPLMCDLFEMADRRQHRQHCFDQHARIPGTALAHLHIGWIRGVAMQAGIHQNHHLLGKLGHQW